jgi:hypothetical protein
MGDRSFGPMWPTTNTHIKTLVRYDGLRLPIHGELLELVRILMVLTELGGYNIKPGETWGYCNRAISGTNTPSNHSQGTAVDINAPANPYASADWHRRNARGTRPFGLAIVTDIPEKVVRAWEDQGFRWGGKYSSHPDPMHFEFMGTVGDARNKIAALKKWINGAEPNPGQPKPPHVAPGQKPIKVIAKEVIHGKWGNGDDRMRRLRAAGYSYIKVMAEVHKQLTT